VVKTAGDTDFTLDLDGNAVMTQIDKGWGAPASARYEQLAAPFRAIFADIRATAVGNEQARVLPWEPLKRLRAAGFARLRLPVEWGGQGVTLPELFNLLIELSTADTSVTNALRVHFGFVEDLLNAPATPERELWLRRVADGATAGSGHSELGDGLVNEIRTVITRDGDAYRVNGKKFYTSGSLFADYFNLAAVDADGKPIGALVPTNAPGVTIFDDWDGFGQALSASGTAVFENVSISADLLSPVRERCRYTVGFFQMVHVASLAGIARSAALDVARLIRERSRFYFHGNGEQAAADPQVLQVAGRVQAAAYASGAIVLKTADALQRAYEAKISGDLDAAVVTAQQADLEVSQAISIVSNLVLDAVTELFDALGASAAKRSHGLDRYWRNARTIASHNPRIYHQRSIGNFTVNGVLPAFNWGRPTSG
jgi:alkylation response protein AidB-like acyl-CoA dehydrogenase